MSGVQNDNTLGLRAYLLGLTPQTRRRLSDELAHDAVRKDVFGAQAALEELRRLADEADGAAARLFFRPLESFLVDDVPSRRHPGGVARSSLPALWAWVRHDLMPEEAAVYTRGVNEALAAGAIARVDRLTGDFQDRVVAVLRAVFADDDEVARRRVLVRIGTPRAAEEAGALRWILRGRDTLGALAARLPATIRHLPHDQAPACMALLESAARPRDLFLYTLLTVMRRLAAPWQIVRLAARAARSTSAARIAETPYGIALDILLADIEGQIAALASALADGEGRTAVALIQAIDATIQGLRVEIVIPVGSTLGRRLNALSAEAAAVARAAIAA